jgi:hypothetical protein
MVTPLKNPILAHPARLLISDDISFLTFSGCLKISLIKPNRFETHGEKENNGGLYLLGAQ